MTTKLKKAPKPSTILARSLALLGSKGQFWGKDQERIEPGETDDDGKEYPEGAYCAIGAIKHIDTPNERKAIAYLGFVIRVETEYFDHEDEATITHNNDFEDTKFSTVKRWFAKAIKLAKANGE